MNEKQTRKEIIDSYLLKAGWNINDQTQVIIESRLGSTSVANEPDSAYSNQFSDYVLLGKEGKALAVVEAKRTSKDAEIGREQAKQYFKRKQMVDYLFVFIPMVMMFSFVI